MKKKPKDNSDVFSRLRKKAEERLKGKKDRIEQASAEETARIIHELGVHQIELEMQNDELREIERQLQKSQQEYADLFESAPVGYLILDTKARIIKINRMGLDILGQPIERINGCPLSMCIDRADLSAFMAHKKQVLNDGLMQECELRIVRADNTTISAYLISKPVKNEAGKIIQCLTSITDLTKTQSERRYHAIADYTYDWESWVGPNGRLLWVNPAVERLTGYTVEEYKNLPDRLKQIIFEEDLETCRACYERCLRQKLSGNDIEFRIRHKNGSLRWASISYQPIYASNGDFLGIRSSIRDITERKRAEEAMKASEIKYRRLYDSMIDAFVSVDMDGKFKEYNQAYLDMLGYTPEELSKLTYIDITPAKWHVFESYIVETQVLPKGYSDIYEKEYRRKNGAVFPLEARTVLLRDEAGKPSGMWGIVRDITNRKLAEETLRQSEERYRSLFESMGEGFSLCEMIYDEANKPVDFRYLKVNPAFATLTGLPVERVEGRTVREVIPHIESFWIESYDRVTSSGLGERFDHIVAELNKQYEVYAWRTGVGRFAALFSDITEVRKAQRLLAESEERFRVVLRNSLITVWNQDKDLRYTWMYNPHPPFTSEDVIGKTDAQLLQADDALRLSEFKRSVLETGIPSQTEMQYRIDGLISTFDITAEPLRSAKGKIVGITCVAVNITGRKEAERKAIWYQKELAHASRLSTIGEMTSSLAHELNQPFCAILTHAEGCIRLLKSQADNREKLIAKMGIIAKQAEHAGRIINLTKNFIRKEPHVLRDIDINEIVKEVMIFVAMEAKRIGIKMHINLDQPIPPILGDTVQIEQVLLNLVKNGLEAMEDVEHKKRVLAITTSLESGKTVKVTVQDHGRGIAAEHADKVFQSFFTTKSNGLGIGLSISRSIIDSYGGKIYVAANSDKGATFCFTLPARLPAES